MVANTTGPYWESHMRGHRKLLAWPRRGWSLIWKLCVRLHRAQIALHQANAYLVWFPWGEQSSRWITLQMTHRCMSELMSHVRKRSTMWRSLALNENTIKYKEILCRFRSNFLKDGKNCYVPSFFGCLVSCPGKHTHLQRFHVKNFVKSFTDAIKPTLNAFFIIQS